jgi:Alginate lyase
MILDRSVLLLAIAVLAAPACSGGGANSESSSSSGGGSSGGTSSSSGSSGGSSSSGAAPNDGGSRPDAIDDFDSAPWASDATLPALPDGSDGDASLTPAVPPSQNFDLAGWDLTLPTGTPGSPTLVPTSMLVAGYTSRYFFTAPDGAMTMFCPVMGVTTTNAKNPRSELRETEGGANYNWVVTTGTATLTATAMVTMVPSVGNKVVVGQIHGNGTTVLPFLELAYKAGDLVAEVVMNPNVNVQADTTLATGIGLGTKFEYQIVTTKAPDLTISINGQMRYHQLVDLAWVNATMYFKAGSYPQANQMGTATDASQVSFYALSTSHGP